jgi:hypothetical protein
MAELIMELAAELRLMLLLNNSIIFAFAINSRGMALADPMHQCISMFVLVDFEHLKLTVESNASIA